VPKQNEELAKFYLLIKLGIPYVLKTSLLDLFSGQGGRIGVGFTLQKQLKN